MRDDRIEEMDCEQTPLSSSIFHLSSARTSERGNVFVFVLLGVVLFGALGFTVTRSMQSETVTNMSEQELSLAADQILNYVQKVDRAAAMIRRRHNCSENEISFENAFISGYEHSPVTRDECKVFGPNGGKINFKQMNDIWYDQNWNSEADFVEIVFQSKNSIVGIGEDSEQDLLLVMPFLDIDLCKIINEKLNIPEYSGNLPGESGVRTIKFTGEFTSTGGFAIADTTTWGGNLLSGITTACYRDMFQYKGATHLYHVLIAR